MTFFLDIAAAGGARVARRHHEVGKDAVLPACGFPVRARRRCGWPRSNASGGRGTRAGRHRAAIGPPAETATPATPREASLEIGSVIGRPPVPAARTGVRSEQLSADQLRLFAQELGCDPAVVAEADKDDDSDNNPPLAGGNRRSHAEPQHAGNTGDSRDFFGIVHKH